MKRGKALASALILAVSFFGMVLSASAASDADNTITIDVSKDVGKVDQKIFGTNVSGFGRAARWGGGVWDPVNGVSEPNAVSGATEAGLRVFRYPSGNYARFWDWNLSIGDIDDRGTEPDWHYPYSPGTCECAVDYTLNHHEFGLDEFLAFIDDVRSAYGPPSSIQGEVAEPMIQVSANALTYALTYFNQGVDLPENAAVLEAARLVTRLKGVVKYYEIDNESYGGYAAVDPLHEAPYLPPECLAELGSEGGRGKTAYGCGGTYYLHCYLEMFCNYYDPDGNSVYCSGIPSTEPNRTYSPSCQHYYAYTAREYAERAAEMIGSMRNAALPGTIKIALDVRRTGTLDEVYEVLTYIRDAGEKPDYLVMHDYAPVASGDSTAQLQVILAAPEQYEKRYQKILQTEQEVFISPSIVTPILLANTEFDIQYNHPLKNTLGNALYLADMLGRFANPKNGFGMATHFTFMDWNEIDASQGVNTRGFAILKRYNNNPNFIPRPTHQVFQMFAKDNAWVNGDFVKTSTISHTFGNPEKNDIEKRFAFDTSVAPQRNWAARISIEKQEDPLGAEFSGSIWFDDIALKKEAVYGDSTNYVRNGDFSIPMLPQPFGAWHYQPSTSSLLQTSRDNDAFRMTFGGETSYIDSMYQCVRLENDTRYEFSARIKKADLVRNGPEHVREKGSFPGDLWKLNAPGNQVTRIGATTEYGLRVDSVPDPIGPAGWQAFAFNYPRSFVYGGDCSQLPQYEQCSFQPGNGYYRLSGKIKVYEDDQMAAPADPRKNMHAAIRLDFRNASDQTLWTIDTPAISKYDTSLSSETDDYANVQLDFKIPDWLSGYTRVFVILLLNEPCVGCTAFWDDVSFTRTHDFSPYLKIVACPDDDRDCQCDSDVTPQIRQEAQFIVKDEERYPLGGWKTVGMKANPYITAYSVVKNEILYTIAINKHSTDAMTVRLYKNGSNAKNRKYQHDIYYQRLIPDSDEWPPTSLPALAHNEDATTAPPPPHPQQGDGYNVILTEEQVRNDVGYTWKDDLPPSSITIYKSVETNVGCNAIPEGNNAALFFGGLLLLFGALYRRRRTRND